MAEVDRRLRTFEENARFMTEYSEFQGLKETKRQLTLQQTKGASGAGGRVAGLTRTAWTYLLLSLAVVVSTVWAFFFSGCTIDYIGRMDNGYTRGCVGVSVCLDGDHTHAYRHPDIQHMHSPFDVALRPCRCQSISRRGRAAKCLNCHHRTHTQTLSQTYHLQYTHCQCFSYEALPPFLSLSLSVVSLLPSHRSRKIFSRQTDRQTERAVAPLGMACIGRLHSLQHSQQQQQQHRFVVS